MPRYKIKFYVNGLLETFIEAKDEEAAEEKLKELPLSHFVTKSCEDLDCEIDEIEEIP